MPENWTIDKLFKKHPSQPYNPDVANAFFRAGLIESWGRGVDVMVQACRKYSLPDPVLRYEDSGFWVGVWKNYPENIIYSARHPSSNQKRDCCHFRDLRVCISGSKNL